MLTNSCSSFPACQDEGDDAMRTTKTELINRYNATVARPDLSLGAYLIDAGHELINGVMV